jgi:hypothetical protein
MLRRREHRWERELRLWERRHVIALEAVARNRRLNRPSCFSVGTFVVLYLLTSYSLLTRPKMPECYSLLCAQPNSRPRSASAVRALLSIFTCTGLTNALAAARHGLSLLGIHRLAHARRAITLRACDWAGRTVRHFTAATSERPSARVHQPSAAGQRCSPRPRPSSPTLCSLTAAMHQCSMEDGCASFVPMLDLHVRHVLNCRHHSRANASQSVVLTTTLRGPRPRYALLSLSTIVTTRSTRPLHVSCPGTLVDLYWPWIIPQLEDAIIPCDCTTSENPVRILKLGHVLAF